MEDDATIRKNAAEKLMQVNSRIEGLHEFQQKFIIAISHQITRQQISIADIKELYDFLEKAEDLLTSANTRLALAKTKAHI